MEIFVVYELFSKWYGLPLKEEQVISDLEELGYHSPFILEKVGINQIKIDHQEFEYLDYLTHFKVTYQNIERKEMTEKQLLALIEKWGVYAIREVDDYYFYENAEEYLETVLSGDDRIYQAKNGVIIEST